jgi:hypothetical protein
VSPPFVSVHLAALLQVDPGAESTVSGAGQDHSPDLFRHFYLIQRTPKLLHDAIAKGIEALGPVELDRGYVALYESSICS